MTDKLATFAQRSDAQGDYNRIRFIVQQMLNRTATTTLVEVVGVVGNSVNVRPMVNQVDGKGTGVPHGTIHALPFFTLRAGSSAVIVRPKVGDIGAAIFCHSDISTVKETKKRANPGSRRRFDWADGLYLGGFLGPDPTTWVTVDDDEGIEVKATTIKLTGDVQITGSLELTGNATITGDATASGTVTGTTDVVGGGKHLKTHTHGGVQTGSGTTGQPS